MVLPKSWSKGTSLAFGVGAVAVAFLIDDGGLGQVKPRSFAPVLNLLGAAQQPSAGHRELSEASQDDVNSTDSDAHGDAHGHDDNGLLFVAVFVGMGVIVNFLLESAGKYFPLPYTVALVVLGGLLGSLNSIGECHSSEHPEYDVNCSEFKHSRCIEYSDSCTFESSLPSALGALGDSVDTWVNIDPGFLLFFFIPALVYASAHSVDVHIFRESFVNVVALAVPGVLMATYLMFAFFYFVYGDNPRYGWSFDACMCFGSILAATDPVAVVALLHDLGAPHKLSIAIEGESLLNDGTALVLFSIFSDALLSIERSIGDQFLFFFRLSLGGIGAGIVVGIISIFCFQMMSNWVQETSWTIGAAYLTFFLCENSSVHFSGVLGVVFLGITVSLYGRTRIENVTFLENFWTMWNFIANTLIFSITGAIVAENIFFEDYVQLEDWGTLFVVYGAQMVIRFLVLAVLSPVLYWSGKRNGYELDHKELTLIWWSGLRGAVGLILALEVGLADSDLLVEDMAMHCPNGTNTVLENGDLDPDCVGHWYIIGAGTTEDVRRFQALLTFFVAGFATLTLLINGLTTRFVVGCLGLTRKSKANNYAFTAATRQLEELMRDQVEDKLKKDPLYRHADWHRVWKAIPVHGWEEKACGRVRIAPDAVHWHEGIDDDDVDDNLEHTIKALEKKSKVIASLLDDAKEMRRNQILARLDSFPDHAEPDPNFAEVFELFKRWAHGKGAAAAAVPVQTEDDIVASTNLAGATLVRSYSYHNVGQRPFTLWTAFTNSDDAEGNSDTVSQRQVDFIKRHWSLLQELRRRFLMLVSASYWHSFHEGFVGAEVVQDLQEISRHSLDSVVKNDEPGKITGFENNEAYKTLDELQQFAIDDWALLHGKFTRCQGSVKRCCDNHGEALRKSRFLDALTAHRTAHTHAFEQYLERYQRSLRKLDNLRSEGDKASQCALIFLGRQVVEDHPLLLDIVMRESEQILSHVHAKIAEVEKMCFPHPLATHQAVMHLLAVQRHAIHVMCEKGLIDHEEAGKLLSSVNPLKGDAVLRRSTHKAPGKLKTAKVHATSNLSAAGPKSHVAPKKSSNTV